MATSRPPRDARHPPRGRRPLPDTERKDRLVQTRVPENLDETLRQEAKKKRVSVSQLIRNVLEDTFNLVDNVVAEATSLGKAVKRDAQRIAASAKGERDATPPLPRRADTKGEGAGAGAADDGIYAWQSVVVNRPTRCARCQRLVARGGAAFLGLAEDPTARKSWLCDRCGARVTHPRRAR